jgi:hypothetical protein
MIRLSKKIIFSPFDLVTYFTSPFASWMERFTFENPKASWSKAFSAEFIFQARN